MISNQVVVGAVISRQFIIEDSDTETQADIGIDTNSIQAQKIVF